MKRNTLLVLGLFTIGILLFSSCARTTCPAYRGSATSHATGPRH